MKRNVGVFSGAQQIMVNSRIFYLHYEIAVYGELVLGERQKTRLAIDLTTRVQEAQTETFAA